MHGPSAVLSRALWGVVAVVLVVGPVLLCDVAVVNEPKPGWEEIAVETGLVAFGLLVVGVLLIARIRSVIAAFGIERVLRVHRAVAVIAVVLIAVHVVAVLIEDPRGWSIFDLRNTANAARAATASTVALVAITVLGIRRRRRQPRYEGWRLMHMFLGATVLGGAWLHILLLGHLGLNRPFLTWLLVMAVVVLAIAFRRWVYLPRRSSRRPYVVEEVVGLSGETVTLRLRARHHGGIRFKPGQFAYLKVGQTPFVLEEHPFSISSTATRRRRKEFTVKALGDFTELLAGLRPGRVVYIDGAYGAMTTDGLERAGGFVFVAGGIGITPMLSMLRTLADRGDKRQHLVLVGTRGLAEEIVEEVVALRERLDLRVVQVRQAADEGWDGVVGRIDKQLLDDHLPKRHRRHRHYFLCGPPAMVEAVEEALTSLGTSRARIHTERFEVV